MEGHNLKQFNRSLGRGLLPRLHHSKHLPGMASGTHPLPQVQRAASAHALKGRGKGFASPVQHARAPARRNGSRGVKYSARFAVLRDPLDGADQLRNLSRSARAPTRRSVQDSLPDIHADSRALLTKKATRRGCLAGPGADPLLPVIERGDLDQIAAGVVHLGDS